MPEKVVSGIYAIRCIASNKLYIGSSKNIYQRWEQHRRELKGGNHHSCKLQRAWNKHGEQNFEFLIIEEVLDGFLFVYEQVYINKFDSCKSGYNILPAAGRPGGKSKLRVLIEERERSQDNLYRENPRKNVRVRCPSSNQLKHLRREQPKWRHLPTKSRRYPEIILEKLDAIAHWADEQEDPSKALESVLEFIKSG